VTSSRADGSVSVIGIEVVDDHRRRCRSKKAQITSIGSASSNQGVVAS